MRPADDGLVSCFGSQLCRDQEPAAPKAAASQARSYKPNAVNNLDCNGWSKKYKALSPTCTDPVETYTKSYKWHGKTSEKRVIGRFVDNGHYVGHDEPSTKFISSATGSGNTMTYFMQLPVNPRKHPTASGSVTTYGELSPAPWFGLPICDPNSYPQNPCTPDSDTNSGSATDPNAAGSAFMELQFYPPGFTPFQDNISCSGTKLNSGDVLKVSITDPAAGFTTTVTDLTTGQTGTMTASAANGFMNTNVKTCAGTPFTFHAEYNTAAQQNQVPWAALEGGVLAEQETGHFETCGSLSGHDPFTMAFASGGPFIDSQAYDVCQGGNDPRADRGEGPCNAKTGVCKNSQTEGTTGPIACPSDNFASGQLCEFAGGRLRSQDPGRPSRWRAGPDLVFLARASRRGCPARAGRGAGRGAGGPHGGLRRLYGEQDCRYRAFTTMYR